MKLIPLKLLIFSIVILSSCKKENSIAKKLDGTWQVNTITDEFKLREGEDIVKYLYDPSTYVTNLEDFKMLIKFSYTEGNEGIISFESSKIDDCQNDYYDRTNCLATNDFTILRNGTYTIIDDGERMSIQYNTFTKVYEMNLSSDNFMLNDFSEDIKYDCIKLN